MARYISAVRAAELALETLRGRRGVLAALARATGTTHQSVQAWTVIPIHHVFTIAGALEVEPESLRPDFFGGDPLRSNRVREILAQSAERPLPRRDRYRPIALTDEHRAIWRDPAYRCRKEAVAAVAKNIGFPISESTLRTRFGAYSFGRGSSAPGLAPLEDEPREIAEPENLDEVGELVGIHGALDT